MATELFDAVMTVQVNGAYSAFTGVKRGSNGKWTQTGAGERIEAFTQRASTAADEWVSVRLLHDPGVHKVSLSGTCASGDLLYPAASGQVATTARGMAVGRATKTGATGDETAMIPLGRGERVSAITGNKTSAYTAAFGETVLCDPSGAGFTVTLPPAVVGEADIVIKNNTTSANTITIDGDASETVDGAANVTIAASRGVKTVRPGAGVWYVVAN